MTAELAELIVPDAQAWREWLGQHYADPGGVWLVLAKKGTTSPTSLTYAQALEEALCHGWIDAQLRRRDDRTYSQRFTPRRPRSPWSKRNVESVDRLTSAGRMHASGLAAVQRARENGNWAAAYQGQAAMALPVDLALALSRRPQAQAQFEVLTGQNRFAVLYRIGSARRAHTRARRIEDFVAMLDRGETVYPQRRTRPR